MRISNLSIHNFKSLRKIEFVPRDLNIIIGANAAGKSNLTEALDFLSEVYRHGLEVAVARKGGYENIAFRRMRRSKGTIRFDIELEAVLHEHFRLDISKKPPHLRFRHSFEFVTRSESIRAEYRIVAEDLQIDLQTPQGWMPTATMERRGQDISVVPYQENAQGVGQRRIDEVLGFGDLELFASRAGKSIAPTELFTTSIGRYTAAIGTFISAASGIRVFRISPATTRQFGVPMPRAELTLAGDNLPAVVDLMKKNSRRDWESVLAGMRAVLPDLEEITVEYTTARTLGLFFQEIGVGRPWSVGEVSDGTIQTLALLVAIFDSRYTALALEEPENSVHPWIIRNILGACREAVKTKQILITSHSPVVIDSVLPEQVWVMWRHKGESRLAPLAKLDPDVIGMWADGQLSTFEYLDSGALPDALPPNPSQVEIWDDGSP
jgi:predicted ATPase